MSLRPAWSEVFRPDLLTTAPALPLAVEDRRDWAFRDATGSGVTVAVVDSGIEATHPAVGGVQEWAAFGQQASGAPVLRTDGPHDDVVGHGTACAGIIRSLAPDCGLSSVRVLGERLSGRGAVFAEGLRWAVQSGARVVNCSLSTSRMEARTVFHDIVDEAAFAGVVVVCAVNNVAGTSVPSTFSSVISVAAHDGRDPLRYDANPQPPVDFGAPGIEIAVPWRGGATVVMTGNSFAAPHLAGHAARLLSKHPELRPYEVKAVLRACADNAVPVGAETAAGAR